MSMSSALAKVTENILRQLESGEALPWRKPWNVPCPMSAGGRRYSGVNRVILSCANFRDHRWVTFNEAKKRGGSIRKGEKGTQVILWKTYQRVEEDETARSGLISQTFTVFNLEQCDGVEVAEAVSPSLFDADIEESLNATIRGFESCPPIKFGGHRACYYPKHDVVQMPFQHHFESPSAYASVMLHELAHSVGHPSRLNRFDPNAPIVKSDTSYGFEEMVAELTSAMICSEIGIIDQGNQNAAYIQSWIRGMKEQKTFLSKASALAERSASFILGRNHDGKNITNT